MDNLCSSCEAALRGNINRLENPWKGKRENSPPSMSTGPPRWIKNHGVQNPTRNPTKSTGVLDTGRVV